MELNIGDLIFVHGKDFISEAIETITHSSFSHVAIYIGNGKVIEAQGGRTVGTQSLDYYNGEYTVCPLDLTGEQLTKSLPWLLAQRGRPYDYWDIFILFLRCVFWLKVPWREGKAVICSILARDWCKQNNLPIPDIDMSPGDLHIWYTEYKKGGSGRWQQA